MVVPPRRFSRGLRVVDLLVYCNGGYVRFGKGWNKRISVWGSSRGLGDLWQVFPWPQSTLTRSTRSEATAS